MSFIIPKKPQILYAPMLGSLGGGSVRGFGRGVGGAGILPGEVIFSPKDPSTGVEYTWAVPEGVTYVSILMIGGGGAGAVGNAGGAGGGGGLQYINNLPVTAGQQFGVIAGRGGIRSQTAWENSNSELPFSLGQPGTSSYITMPGIGVAASAWGGSAGGHAGTTSSGSPALGGAGGNNVVLTGFQNAYPSVVTGGNSGGEGGSDSGNSSSPGGGGAGGYSSNGGNGAWANSAGSNANGGAGGGGGSVSPNSYYGGMNGGSVGIFGSSGTSSAGGGNYSNTSAGSNNPNNYFTSFAWNNSVSPASRPSWQPVSAHGWTRYNCIHYGHDTSYGVANGQGHHPDASSYSNTNMGYGGGGGGSNDGSMAGSGASGVVRIIWGGSLYETTRTFPSTNVQRSNQLAGANEAIVTVISS